MIGGLVEQQHIGLFEQQLGQRQAHLPAAGKFLGAPGPIFLAEPQAVEHSADLRFDRIAVAIAEFGIDVMQRGRPPRHIRRSAGSSSPNF